MGITVMIISQVRACCANSVPSLIKQFTPASNYLTQGVVSHLITLSAPQKQRPWITFPPTILKNRCVDYILRREKIVHNPSLGITYSVYRLPYKDYEKLCKY